MRTSAVGAALETFNPLKPNDLYMRRTAQLTSRRCILNIQQIYVLNILNMLQIFHFFIFKMPFIS